MAAQSSSEPSTGVFKRCGCRNSDTRRRLGALCPSLASHTFTRRIRAMGLPPVRLHDLRHGAASLNFAAHDDLKAVQALLGHSSPVITAKIYISVLPELARRRAQATAHMLLTAARVKPDAGNSQA